MKKVAFYTRVSTASQSCAAQEAELRQIATRAGWHIVEIYSDHGVSGARSRKDRPAFDRLLKDASRRKFDIVGAWSVDRLGRSLQDLVGFLKEIRALGIDLYLHQQGLDTTTPAGTAMFQMLGVFSEFERSLIRERVLAGLARARANGQRLGRPSMPREKHEAVVAALREGGHSLRVIAKQCRVGLTSVQRIKERMHVSPP